ncbi:MAG: YifB family Mg chelatase-like AAA ATPase [Actinomycetaceae bacterium]|nr:YifB family Mg chelatase-like AAA ATPase [Actinomycetaceae bacterium]
MKPILVRTHAVALTGITANIISVETHVGSGLVSFNLVGMPDASVRESRDRVRAAMQSCGIDWFEHRVTVNLSPAGIPKAGSAFDLAIAVGLLAARGVLPPSVVDGTVFTAELGLDGSLRPIRGILSSVLGAKREGMKQVVVSDRSLAEAQLVPGVEILGFSHLRDLVTHFGGRLPSVLPPLLPKDILGQKKLVREVREHEQVDLADVKGQSFAVEGLILAAAGGHHMLMLGEPGAGKTMLARRLPTILPALDDEDAIAATAIHSVSGTFDSSTGLIRTPPIEMPHHSATMAAIIGGGSGVPRPGAISRAHAGVLVLDEAAEFSPQVLDAMREPLESGVVNLQRARHHVEYPARFQLILASNPCPCGHAISRRKSCTCSSIQQRRYLSRLSGPLLDRLDIQIPMMTPSPAQLAEPPAYSSKTAKEAVERARARARKRWAGTPWSLNAHVPAKLLRDPQYGIDSAVHKGIEHAIEDGTLSLRGATRVLRLALTVADVRGADRAGLPELSKALMFRNGVENANA